MIRIIENKLILTRYLWHGTKYLDYIARDNLILKTSQRSGFVEGIRFTSDPVKLVNYAIFPFWVKISTRKLKASDFERIEGLWKEEDEYLYIGNKTFDLKPHIEEIYVHDKVKDYFIKPRWKGKYYKHIENVVFKYNIPLIFDKPWVWGK